MAAAAMPLMLAASLVSATGQLAAGSAQASAYKQNAQNARQQATVAEQQSFVRAGEVEREAGQRAGQATAAMGAAGVVSNQGSALHVLNEIATRGEMAKQMELYQGRLTATGYRRQADIDMASAKAARTASYFGAGSTLLGGVARAAAMQYGGKTAGGGG